ncbi:MAG: hypothetical protein K0S32_1756 [Bacteroidetes bacterium]|jgi:hypothetical protein|nr:hypothetical protein [Bacteroidota bacterium]
MKKLISAIALVTLSLCATAASLKVEPGITMSNHDWKKSEKGNWMGNNKVWYKLNKNDKTIWMSTDGKKWDKAKDNMWQSKDGKWVKINDGKVVESGDSGKTWTEASDWTWEGGNGMFYKFDLSWDLWESKG